MIILASSLTAQGQLGVNLTQMTKGSGKSKLTFWNMGKKPFCSKQFFLGTHWCKPSKTCQLRVRPKVSWHREQCSIGCQYSYHAGNWQQSSYIKWDSMLSCRFSGDYNSVVTGVINDKSPHHTAWLYMGLGSLSMPQSLLGKTGLLYTHSCNIAEIHSWIVPSLFRWHWRKHG